MNTGIARVPLNNDDISLAYRCGRNHAVFCKHARIYIDMGLVKNTNTECGHTCKPQRARPEAHIYSVAYMDVGQGREQERKLCASCKGQYINCAIHREAHVATRFRTRRNISTLFRGTLDE